MKTVAYLTGLVALSILGVYWYAGTDGSESRLEAEPIKTLANPPLTIGRTNTSSEAPHPQDASSGMHDANASSASTDSTPLAAFRATIAQIKSQPYNDAWAKQAAPEVRNSLSAVLSAQRDVGRVVLLQDVDCHQNACVVTIEWPSFNDAAASWESFLLSPMQPNCDREIVLDDSLADKTPYRGFVAVTNCTST